MRVIGGRLGGRRIVAPPGRGTRPVTDRVRESLFSSLGDAVVGGRVLDLYAGAGTLGLEAASRGAVGVVFVERDRAALEALRANVAGLGLAGLGVEARVVASSVDRFLASAEAAFDVVFCDPPWDTPEAEVSAVLTAAAARLSPGGLVVVSRRASDPALRPRGLVEVADRRYGDTRITRYRREETP